MTNDVPRASRTVLVAQTLYAGVRIVVVWTLAIAGPWGGVDRFVPEGVPNGPPVVYRGWDARPPTRGSMRVFH